METRLGIKRLTPENWLQPDESTLTFVRLDWETGRSRHPTGEERLEELLEPRLSEHVPEDVQRLFEVARGAMAYGYFFYPLYSLAHEQLYRVLEAAVTHKWKAIGGPARKARLADKIDWLIERGVVQEQDRQLWHELRSLRNIASHPELQSISTPGQAAGALARTARHINQLFVRS